MDFQPEDWFQDGFSNTTTTETPPDIKARITLVFPRITQLKNMYNPSGKKVILQCPIDDDLIAWQAALTSLIVVPAALVIALFIYTARKVKTSVTRFSGICVHNLVTL